MHCIKQTKRELLFGAVHVFLISDTIYNILSDNTPPATGPVKEEPNDAKIKLRTIVE